MRRAALRRWLRTAGALVLGSALAACASSPSLPAADPGTVRIVDGVRVQGHYVSPSAYQHYILAQLATHGGHDEDALDELRRALVTDGESAYLRTRMAEELVALGRLDEAREALEAALRCDAGFADAEVLLGRVAWQLGDTTNAEAAFKKALAMDKHAEEAWLALGALYRERGDLAKADATYRGLVEKVPQSAAGHLQLARSALVRGDGKAAEAELRQTLSVRPGSIEASLELGQLLFAQGRLIDAQFELRKGYERSMHDVRVAQLLVSAEVAVGNTDEADAILDGLAASGGPAHRRLAVGALMMERRRPAQALAIAGELLSTGESAGARLLHGAALLEVGRTEEGLADLGRIAVDSPEYARAQLRIGKQLLDEHHVTEAKAGLVRAQALLGARVDGKPEGDRFVALLALVEERSGARAGAEKLLEAAIKKSPDSDTLVYSLAELAERGGNPERAVELVRGLLRRNPDDAEAMNFIGWTLVDRGLRFAEAQKLLERAAQLRPLSGPIADSLGVLYVKLGRLDDAARLLERAERLMPSSAEVTKHVGDLHARRADRVRALAAYRHALEQKPDEKLRRLLEEQVLLLQDDRVAGTR